MAVVLRLLVVVSCVVARFVKEEERSSGEVIGLPPDLSVAAVVDAVAAKFVAANGRGHEGFEPPLLKAAAGDYRSKLSSLAMPWRDTSTATVGEAVIPNYCHWVWRDGDADWTLALSVIMAKIVQRPEKLYVHSGPVFEGDWTFATPKTAEGEKAFECMEAAGAEEISHLEDPRPGGQRHPWAEVMKKGRKKLNKQTLAHISDVMRLFAIVEYGGLYLDRDAFIHLPIDHYRYNYEAVLGLDPETFEGDHDVNFGTFMAKKNATFMKLLWDGMGFDDYKNLSYAVTWGGWAHDSCRKSFALAMKRPDLCHLDERLYQFPFTGKGAARGSPRGKTSPRLFDTTKTHEVLHMSGFDWHSARTEQLQWRPSLWGEIIWPNVRAHLRVDDTPRLLSCVTWLQDMLLNRKYIDQEHIDKWRIEDEQLHNKGATSSLSL